MKRLATPKDRRAFDAADELIRLKAEVERLRLANLSLEYEVKRVKLELEYERRRHE